MLMARSAIESCLTSLPETVDSEEVMYRLYLLEKIEAGEKDLREGRVVSHDEAMEDLPADGRERYRLCNNRRAW